MGDKEELMARNRVRDYAIWHEYTQGGVTRAALGRKYSLSHTHITLILWKQERRRKIQKEYAEGATFEELQKKYDMSAERLQRQL